MAKILVVDDSNIMRRNLKRVLEDGGHEVIDQASDGEEALAKYERHRPDLVTMDISMPKVNGIEAVKNIISKFSDAKIVMISALDQKYLVF